MKQPDFLQLGDSAILHANEVLDFGNELCNLAAEALKKLTSPQAFTFLPLETNTQEVKFNKGGLNSNMFPELGKYLYEKNKKYSLICDDVMAAPNDSYIEKKVTRKSSTDNDIYHLASVNEIRCANDMVDLVGQVSVSWHFVCVLLKAPQILPAQINFSDLNVNNVSKVVVGAFDGEGFLVIDTD